MAGIFLTHEGYELIEHGYRCPEGEADYIAYDPVEECVVLVGGQDEARAKDSFGVVPRGGGRCAQAAPNRPDRLVLPYGQLSRAGHTL